MTQKRILKSVKYGKTLLTTSDMMGSTLNKGLQMTEPFAPFLDMLQSPDLIATLRDSVIGEGKEFEGAYGPRKLIYADYVASGRALRQVETFMIEHVLPFYGNTHTETSHCGAATTRLREGARETITRICGADDQFSTVFTGSGATAGLNRMVLLLGTAEAVAAGRPVRVFVGPYEHHSNILPWRESGAEVIEIAEAPNGGPDLVQLAEKLAASPPDAIKIGTFSIASNVTGIVTNADVVTRLLKAHGAIAIWDYAGGGPYLPIDMCAGTDAQKDVVVLSPHKFLGGPGASGVMIINRAVVARQIPVFPGGGTVLFVSPWAQDYSKDIATREEGGTPNIVGDIRAALCFLVKEAIGQQAMDERHAAHDQRARAVWDKNPAIEIMGNTSAEQRLPFFSLRIKNGFGGYRLYQEFTALLSDHYGIQARGGCACAGPYAHRLLGIEREASEQLRREILGGNEETKPGWTRLNLSVLTSDAKADFIIKAVDALARGKIPATGDANSCAA